MRGLRSQLIEPPRHRHFHVRLDRRHHRNEHDNYAARRRRDGERQHADRAEGDEHGIADLHGATRRQGARAEPDDYPPELEAARGMTDTANILEAVSRWKAACLL